MPSIVANGAEGAWQFNLSLIPPYAIEKPSIRGETSATSGNDGLLGSFKTVKEPRSPSFPEVADVSPAYGWLLVLQDFRMTKSLLDPVSNPALQKPRLLSSREGWGVREGGSIMESQQKATTLQSQQINIDKFSAYGWLPSELRLSSQHFFPPPSAVVSAAAAEPDVVADSAETVIWMEQHEHDPMYYFKTEAVAEVAAEVAAELETEAESAAEVVAEAKSAAKAIVAAMSNEQLLYYFQLLSNVNGDLCPPLA
ncbi:hypothetical protein BGX38DRAFT_1269769 [Terfezia claveryi]|nr:hypothetical protein BGX38DRAFT_1269769 [Terfezia claveryi]